MGHSWQAPAGRFGDAPKRCGMEPHRGYRPSALAWFRNRSSWDIRIYDLTESGKAV